MLLVVLLPSPTLPIGSPPMSAPVTTSTLTLIRLVDPFPAVLLTLTVLEALEGCSDVQIEECPAWAPASPGSLSTRFVQVKPPLSLTEIVMSAEEPFVSADTLATNSELAGAVNEADVISTPFAGVPVNLIGLEASIAMAIGHRLTT